MKRIIVRDSDRRGEYPPEKLADFMAWLTLAVSEIPEEFLASAMFTVESSPCYDSAEHSIEISYKRPFNEEEIQHKKDKEEQILRNRRDEELKTLAALQAKYGAAP